MAYDHVNVLSELHLHAGKSLFLLLRLFFHLIDCIKNVISIDSVSLSHLSFSLSLSLDTVVTYPIQLVQKFMEAFINVSFRNNLELKSLTPFVTNRQEDYSNAFSQTTRNIKLFRLTCFSWALVDKIHSIDIN